MCAPNQADVNMNDAFYVSVFLPAWPVWIIQASKPSCANNTLLIPGYQVVAKWLLHIRSSMREGAAFCLVGLAASSPRYIL